MIPTTSSTSVGGLCSRNISVSVAPGDTEFTVIARGPNSRAATFTNCSSAALLAAYNEIPGPGTAVFSVDSAMIRPPSGSTAPAR